MDTTFALSPARCRDHACMTGLRRSGIWLRCYACTTELPGAWASADPATSKATP
jgi:hypothetical protein